MRKTIVFFALLVSMLASTNSSYAYFQIKQQHTVIAKAFADHKPFLVQHPAFHERRHSIFQKIKERMAFKMLRKTDGAPASTASVLNILSFCFGFLGNVFGILLIGAVIAAAATTGFFLISALLFGLAGIVTGIIGLARHEKQKGLAIAGIVISCGVFLEIVIALIAAIILGVISAIV